MEKITSEGICHRLKQIRINLNMSRTKFAEEINISKSHYANIENGHRYITLDMLDAMYNRFGISPNYVLCGRGEVYINSDETMPDIYGMDNREKMMLLLQLYDYFAGDVMISNEGEEVGFVELMTQYSDKERLRIYRDIVEKYVGLADGDEDA